MPRKRRQTARDRDDGDPLGTLIQQYRVSLAGVLVLGGAVALIGLGLLAFGLTRKAHSLMFLLGGAVAMVMAFALVAINTFNVGRWLELRKHGIRFIEPGTETELAWDEIADIEVRRLDRTYLGPVSLWKRSSDASSPSGLLTNTEFTVIIHSHDGRGIRLSSMFLRSVSDPRKLISQLRLRAGLRSRSRSTAKQTPPKPLIFYNQANKLWEARFCHFNELATLRGYRLRFGPSGKPLFISMLRMARWPGRNLATFSLKLAKLPLR